MPWLQVRLAISPEQAETYEDALLEVGAVSVTFMDAEDQPIFEPDLNTTPLWSHTHLLALFEADADPEQVFAHLRTADRRRAARAPSRGDRGPGLGTQLDGQLPADALRPAPVDRAELARSPGKDAVNLLLDPGLAFGTGTHPTTALCLEWLDGQQLKAPRCWTLAAARASSPSPPAAGRP
jgi:ribosomal protein L11 methyltransferase